MFGNDKQFSENAKRAALSNYQGAPAEVASLVPYLVPTESCFITGQNFGR